MAHIQIENTYYPLSTLKVKALNNKAIKSGFNTALSDECINALDKNGTHLMNMMMPLHCNATGKVSSRVMLMMKLKGNNKPQTAFLDISQSDWQSITEKIEGVKA
jgi:hypothetical protein